jgi:prolyl-tRNA synthetase
MRVGNLFGQTLRDAPADAQIPSHRLLVRGAFIRQVAAGVYVWLPLGLRVLRKVEQIVREEMDRAGAVELLMSLLQPGELWQRSGRWDAYGPVLYRFKDRSDRDFCLAPTHEEMITLLAETELPSYRDLPKIPYHIQWKFRDEPRPRGGLLRGREFLMKDAYSFDATEDGLLESYAKMAAAYHASFERCVLEPVQIEAHAGEIGGEVSHEFTVPCPNGGDTFVRCENGDYSANTEVASGRPARPYDFGEPPAAPEKVHTPGKVTVADVAQLLGAEPRQLVKTLIFKKAGSDDLLAAVVPGDRELNELKLAKVLGATPALVGDDEFAARGIAKGYSGPVGLRSGMPIYADRALEGARNLVTGSNEPDYHLTGVVPGRDFEPEAWVDLIVAADGDLCDRCGGKLVVEKGIEVGHIFQLVGADYIAKLGATFTDPDGKEKPFVMGCYGLGISRTVAAVVEVHHDDRGIKWPRSVAPYDVCVVVLSDDPKAASMATDLERDLEGAGIGCIVDDRTGVSPGVKFADADLIGCPLQIVIGKSFLSSGKLEAKVRSNGERSDIEPNAEAVRTLLDGCP